MKVFNTLLLSVLISIASLKGFSQDFAFLMADEPVVEQKTKLIIFSAEWCGPCRMMKKFMFENPSADITKVLDNYEIVLYDYDTAKEEVSKYKISSIPVMISEKNDKEVARIIGYSPSKVRYFLNKYK